MITKKDAPTHNNFDRIKAMTIEEMAEWLAAEIPHGDCYCCTLCDQTRKGCRESWLIYLQTNMTAIEQDDD